MEIILVEIKVLMVAHYNHRKEQKVWINFKDSKGNNLHTQGTKVKKEEKYFYKVKALL